MVRNRAFLPSLMMVATLLLAPSVGRAEPASGAPETPPMPNLHKMLMSKFDAMNKDGKGIFHNDVTASLAPYFPSGQPIAETRRILAKEDLGRLRPFKGTNDPGMGKMFVTKVPLVSAMFSNVNVIIDFDYDGAGAGEKDMTLKAMKAYIDASNM